MVRITPDRPWSLFDTVTTRALEQGLAATLPPHTLMARAGLSVARLALALAPHARQIWIACGPGNNGGDGLEAAMHLQHWGKAPVVTWLGDPATTPPDARKSWGHAKAAGVQFSDAAPTALTTQDLCIDALLGLGAQRPPDGLMAEWLIAMAACPAPVLAVDSPSGLHSDTGHFAFNSEADHADLTRHHHQFHAQNTLSLLTLKPGLFTAHGRDTAGNVWWDDLGLGQFTVAPRARLTEPPPPRQRRHASHKGSYGDVAVIGGAPGMGGAALLAGQAALYGGAGRVYVCLLDPAVPVTDVTHPELMLRSWSALDLQKASVVCGCGGGDAVRAVMARVLSTAEALVLDADALNAVAADTGLQALLKARGQRHTRRASDSGSHGMPWRTILTPHPLEAARLLACTVQEIQADRLDATERLAGIYGCTVVLKGSGTIVAQPAQITCINPTGNARLATAGTGDVLAGMIGASLASGLTAFDAARWAVYTHGTAADTWPSGLPFSAGALAGRAGN